MDSSYPAYELVNEYSLLIRFGERIDAQTSDQILRMSAAAKQLLGDGLTDIIPAYTTLLVLFDPLKFPPETVKQKFQQAWPASQNPALPKKDLHPLVEIPVLYDPVVGPDLLAIARQLKLDWQEVAALHAAVQYQVYALGFSPGFAFMGHVDSRLQFPRRPTPRTRVPAGSLAIAEFQTAIYPQQSPGGWHIIGRTPIAMFTLDNEPPNRLQVGARVRFNPINSDEFRSLGGNFDDF